MPLLPTSSTPAPLQILYQDQWMVAIHKPAGHLVHPASTPQDEDLVAMKILRDQIGERVYSIHRLDRPTSGVLLFGIDREVSKKLHHAFAHQNVTKTYWAITKGHPTQPHWICNAPIQKEENAPIREAETAFQVLKKIHHPSGVPLSLIEAIPHTGRFHQIRRHLLHSGYPIIGDYRYAGIEESNNNGELLGTGTAMLLLAKSLQLIHPINGETIHIQTQHPLIEMLSK